jgi:hypothetical protein
LPLGWGLPGLFAIRFLRPLLETAVLVLTLVGVLAGWVDAPLAGVVLLATVGLGIILSMATVVFGELAETTGSDPDRLLRMFLCVFPENLGYRQIRNLWLIAGYAKRGGPEK